MGLIKAAKDSFSSIMSDQWREYFYCDSLSNDVLMVKGQKRQDSGRKNNNGNDNIISNGSIVAVNEGQCMIIVDQGGIVDVCAEAGEFVYDTSTEASLFYGSLGDNIKNTFTTMAKRFTFGGNTAKDQRVYFFNTKEILNNMYGTATPIPFHIIDRNTGFEFETNMKCNGKYTFKLVDPLLFYKNVAGNVRDTYTKTELLSNMKDELIEALKSAVAEIAGNGVLPSQVAGHSKEITQIVVREMSAQWTELRGVEIVTLTMNPSFPEADLERINKWADTAVLRNGAMAEARRTEAFTNMMEGKNGSGSNGGNSGDAMGNMMNMMAMNMMGNMMGNGAFGGMMGTPASAGQQAQPQMQPQAAPVLGWTCSCGKTDNRGKFCAECGSPKPAAAGWTCSCGHVNQGKFCQECGKKKPEGAPMYKCDKCGWEPEDPAHPPKFCPECGDIFDENDRV
ncbi:MAG: SPFH domain-containing protein [Acetatifactor sp.]